MNSLQTWHTMNNKLSVVYMLQKFLDDYRILDCNLQRVSLEHLSDGKVPWQSFVNSSPDLTYYIFMA